MHTTVSRWKLYDAFYLGVITGGLAIGVLWIFS